MILKPLSEWATRGSNVTRLLSISISRGKSCLFLFLLRSRVWVAAVGREQSGACSPLCSPCGENYNVERKGDGEDGAFQMAQGDDGEGSSALPFACRRFSAPLTLLRPPGSGERSVAGTAGAGEPGSSGWCVLIFPRQQGAPLGLSTGNTRKVLFRKRWAVLFLFLLVF